MVGLGYKAISVQMLPGQYLVASQRIAIRRLQAEAQEGDFTGPEAGSETRTRGSGGGRGHTGPTSR